MQLDIPSKVYARGGETRWQQHRARFCFLTSLGNRALNGNNTRRFIDG